MKDNRNTLIIVCSIIVGVLAAVTATLLVLKHIKGKKEKLEATNLVFENDFDVEEEEAVEF